MTCGGGGGAGRVGPGTEAEAEAGVGGEHDGGDKDQGAHRHCDAVAQPDHGAGGLGRA